MEKKKGKDEKVQNNKAMIITGFFGSKNSDLIMALADYLYKKEYKILIVDHNEEQYLANALPKPLRLSFSEDVVCYSKFDFTERAVNAEWVSRYDFVFLDFGMRMGSIDTALVNHHVFTSDFCVNNIGKIMKINEELCKNKSEKKQQDTSDIKSILILRDTYPSKKIRSYITDELNKHFEEENIREIPFSEKDNESYLEGLYTGEWNKRVSADYKRIIKELGCLLTGKKRKEKDN